MVGRNQSEPIQITFLRHGRSLADDEERLEGSYNSPLTEAGRVQVRTRAEQWIEQQVQFDLVIASSLDRARETAEIVTGLLRVPLETDPGWNEISKGNMDGLTFAEANRLYPHPAFRSQFEGIAGSAESEIDFHSRISLALQRVIRRGPGRYLVVSHGGAMNAALRVIAGAPIPINGTGVWFSFGYLGFAVTRYQPDNPTWVVQELRHGLD